MKNNHHFLKSLEGFSINEKNHLSLNSLDLVELAKLSDRPLYILNEIAIRKNIRAYQSSLSTYYPGKSEIFYASKAFLNLGMCYLLNQEGIGLDVCSEGELFIAQNADFPSAKIIFHGNNKSQVELEKAIQANIQCIMVDNACELEDILKISQTKATTTNVMFRINPVVEVDTHAYIATGVKDSKFGLEIDDPATAAVIETAFKSSFLHFKGIHFHLGSQVFDFVTYKQAIKKIVAYIKFLNDKGIEVEALNIGGGLGTPYTVMDSSLTIERFIQELCSQICQEYQLNNLKLPTLMVEPGRSIIAASGCTIYKIGHIKDYGSDVLYAAVNGGMSDNLRPSLYQSEYSAVIGNKMNWQGPTQDYKIVGKCCETGDVLIQRITLAQCQAGDILIMFVTGAYQHALTSNYNKHTLPGILLVDEGTYEWITKEQTYAQLIQNDVVPKYLKKPRLRYSYAVVENS